MSYSNLRNIIAMLDENHKQEIFHHFRLIHNCKIFVHPGNAYVHLHTKEVGEKVTK